MDWDPTKHPRAPAGAFGSIGGQFIPAGFGLKVTHVTTGFQSKHFGTGGRKFNENNIGLGFATADGFVAGVYRNSLNRTSVYAGKELRHRISPNIEAGVMVGAVTGYPGIKGSGVMPLALPELLLSDDEKKNVLAITIVPPIGRHVAGAVALQYRRSFK